MRIATVKHFAKVFSVLTDDKKRLEALLPELEDFVVAFESSNEMVNFLLNKNIELDKKKDVLKKVIKDDLLQSFILAVIDNNKLKKIRLIYEKARQFYLESNKVKEIEVYSAIELSKDELNSLKKIIQDKIKEDLIIKNIVEPELLGGVRLRIGDTVIDSTIIGKINRLKNKIISFE